MYGAKLTCGRSSEQAVGTVFGDENEDFEVFRPPVERRCPRRRKNFVTKVGKSGASGGSDTHSAALGRDDTRVSGAGGFTNGGGRKTYDVHQWEFDDLWGTWPKSDADFTESPQ